MPVKHYNRAQTSDRARTCKKCGRAIAPGEPYTYAWGVHPPGLGWRTERIYHRDLLPECEPTTQDESRTLEANDLRTRYEGVSGRIQYQADISSNKQ